MALHLVRSSSYNPPFYIGLFFFSRSLHLLSLLLPSKDIVAFEEEGDHYAKVLRGGGRKRRVLGGGIEDELRPVAVRWYGAGMNMVLPYATEPPAFFHTSSNVGTLKPPSPLHCMFLAC